MPQQRSCASSVDRNAVVLENRDQILIELRLVAIAVAGGEQRHLAGGLGSRAAVGCGSRVGAGRAWLLPTVPRRRSRLRAVRE